MAVKRYVGDKVVGLDSERDGILHTISDGATYYSSDSPYKVYIKQSSGWQQVSGGSGSGTSGSSGSSGSSPGGLGRGGKSKGGREVPPPFPPGGEPHGLSSNKFILVRINDVYNDFI